MSQPGRRPHGRRGHLVRRGHRPASSYDEDTDRRDRVEKPRAYAETGIPVYLLIDRDSCEVKVHSQPDGVRYEQVVTVPYGKTVTLPDPVGIELDTEPLKNWTR